MKCKEDDLEEPIPLSITWDFNEYNAAGYMMALV